MAAHMKDKGIYHGTRTTATHAPSIPSMEDVGSAAYRRRLAALAEMSMRRRAKVDE